LLKTNSTPINNHTFIILNFIRYDPANRLFYCSVHHIGDRIFVVCVCKTRHYSSNYSVWQVPPHTNTGLKLQDPFIENIYSKISIQNRSVELEFQAVTFDQANVYFKAMLLYSVLDQQEETIKNVAFKFVDDRNLMQALIRTVEGSIRAFVATKRQSEVLILRRDIVEHVKEQLDVILEGWGYHLQDLQLNDITFDDVIMKSMSQVVASNNLKAAAENEGQALLITKNQGCRS